MIRNAAMFCMIASLASTPALAIRGSDVLHEYYSDSSHRRLVGSIEYTCGGGILKFGHKTPFVRTQSDSCRPNRVNMTEFAGARRDPQKYVDMCKRRCVIKYHVGLCLPESCPTNDAAAECSANCEHILDN